MIFCIDIGNTNIVLGIFKEKKLLNTFRISTDYKKTEDEYGILIQNLLYSSKINLKEIKAAVISNVVPALRIVFERLIKKYFNLKALWVEAGIKTGMPILTDHPQEVGADLIVGAAAAYELYKRTLIVVDFGTATTFSAVSKKGEFIGTAISPGIRISSEALFLKAAKLPHIELAIPKSVIGKNTISSMQAGIIFGYIGLVEKIIQKFIEELKEEILVVATGGLAKFIWKEIKGINKFESDLILYGLNLIYERNQ